MLPENYIAYFRRFEYLNQVADGANEARSRITDQTTNAKNERTRTAALFGFVHTFDPRHRFAVLDGVFSEGIDLPDDRHVGAFVVTLGLPQFNAVNDQFKLRLENYFWRGTSAMTMPIFIRAYRS